MALGLTKPAKDVYAPTTTGGDARGAVMGEAQRLHMEIEAVIEAAIETSLSFQGAWDASAGSFPGSGAATKGQSWRVTVAGTVDSVAFAVGDLIIALVNSASTSTYAANWIKVPAALAPVVRGTDSGAGTANAIQVTTSQPIATDGGQLISFVVFEANTSTTVTVSFNGGSALSVQSASGNDPAVGALAAGLTVIGMIVSTEFILLSDLATAAMMALIEAAVDDAETAATNAGTSATNAGNSETAAAASASAAANSVAALGYAFSTTTTDGDPGSGVFRLNNATVASATEIYLDNLDADGVDVSAIIDQWDDSTNTIRGQLTIRSKVSAAVKHVFDVTGSVVDGTGYRKATIAYVAGDGSLTDTLACWVLFERAGDKGTDGAGTGDVVGPASATDNALARFDGTTGKLVQTSVATLSDAGNFVTTGTFTSAGYVVDRAAGNTRAIGFRSSASQRWEIGASATAESGSNAGSNLYINRFSDAGSYLSTPFSIDRYSGEVFAPLMRVTGTYAIPFVLNASYRLWSDGTGNFRTKASAPGSATDGDRLLTDAHVASVANYRAATADKLLDTDAVWGAMAEVTLTDAATIDWDMSAGFDFTVTLTASRTLGNPTSTTVGKRGRIRVVQDGTGGWTLTKSSNHKTAGGAALSIAAAAGAETYIYYDCVAADKVLLSNSPLAWS